MINRAADRLLKKLRMEGDGALRGLPRIGGSGVLGRRYLAWVRPHVVAPTLDTHSLRGYFAYAQYAAPIDA